MGGDDAKKKVSPIIQCSMPNMVHIVFWSFYSTSLMTSDGPMVNVLTANSNDSASITSYSAEKIFFCKWNQKTS